MTLSVMSFIVGLVVALLFTNPTSFITIPLGGIVRVISYFLGLWISNRIK
jgi:hypothetical protein